MGEIFSDYDIFKLFFEGEFVVPQFIYGQKELDYLAAADDKMARLIARCGKIERQTNPDVFAALVSSIISQQISGKAAATIQQRVEKLAGGTISPQSLSKLAADSLSTCGLSRQKVHYLQAAAQAALSGQIDFAALHRLPDDKVVDALTALPGVGRWTAEMLLIFSLSRKDVISYADFGIRKGLQLLYGMEKINKKDFDRITKSYRPYATIASFYLWHAANNNIVV